jgi:hypothetical protein
MVECTAGVMLHRTRTHTHALYDASCSQMRLNYFTTADANLDPSTLLPDLHEAATHLLGDHDSAHLPRVSAHAAACCHRQQSDEFVHRAGMLSCTSL